MKKQYFACTLSIAFALFYVQAFSQQHPEEIQVDPPKVINFQQLAEWESVNPIPMVQHYIRQEEDIEDNVTMGPRAVAADAVVFQAPTPASPSLSGLRATSSPAPSIEFSGVLDNGTLIPPDIRGAIGPNSMVETTNQQFNIYNRSGSLLSTLSVTTFFSSTGGSGYFDPHVMYDNNNGRFIIIMDGNVSNGDGGIFVGVSQTSDPTGSWYIYSFDGLGNKTDFLDYPLLGYNNNWVVVTGNDFINSSSPVYAKIYVMNRASLYSGTLGTVSTFTDETGFSIDPAQTFDASQNTEYLVEDDNGNSGGNGYMRLSTITGTATAPVYTVGSTIGVTSTWSETAVNASQEGETGSTKALNTDDTRVGNAVVINGNLWFTHTVFLPASSPTYSGVDWYEVNPSAASLEQYYRLNDPAGKIFYYFPSIAVNSAGDMILGYSTSSSTAYGSAGYAFHAATDAANSLETGYIFKSGVAGYYKTYGSGRNRWGDFSGTSIDPTDNSLWAYGEWANTGSDWATAIARIPASSGVVTCNAPTGMTTSAITSSSATFTWSAASGANSYNVEYGIVGSSPLTTVTASGATVSVSGLTAGSNYQWQVQTVCASGSSAYTAATDFTTTSTTCSAPTGMTTSAITSSSATFTWSAATGANSYNVEYGVVGSSPLTTVTASGATVSVSGLTAGSNYQWQVQTVCSAGSSAYTAATDFTTSGGTTCNVPTGMATSSITSSSATFSWSAVTGATSYNIEYGVVGSSPLTTVTASGATVSVSGLTASTNYQWQVQTVCASGSSAYTAATDFTTGSSSLTYCTSTSTSTAYEYIKKVVLGTISNTNTNTTSGYVNYTSLSTNLAAGSNTITLTPGFTGSSYTEAFTVWIDYNHNGVFTDAGEEVAEVKGSKAVSKAFTVPTTALNGPTRMRIQMQYSTYETNSCATYTYGQVQDYTVNITGGTASPVEGDAPDNNASTTLAGMKVYPNPAQNYVTVEFSSSKEGSSTINIYNLAGQRLGVNENSAVVGFNTATLQTGNLADGLYIVEVESNGTVLRQKLIISR